MTKFENTYKDSEYIAHFRQECHKYKFGKHFYWPTNALNCIKLKRLKSTCINILKDN